MIKKNLLVTLFVATIAGSMLMGCTSNASSQPANEVVETVETEETEVNIDEEAAPKSESVDDGKFASLEDYFNVDANKKANDALLESMLQSSSSMFSDIQFECKGNDLIYTFVLVESLELSADDLNAQYDAQVATVEASKDEIESSVGVRPSAIKYVYKNFDGSEITTLEY